MQFPNARTGHQQYCRGIKLPSKFSSLTPAVCHQLYQSKGTELGRQSLKNLGEKLAKAGTSQRGKREYDAGWDMPNEMYNNR